MKKILFPLMVLLSMACSNPQPEHAAVPDKVAMADQGGIKLAEGMLVSKNDTVCGMTVGNEPNDTLTFEGKLYGFCGSGCKETFIAEHSSK